MQSYAYSSSISKKKKKKTAHWHVHSHKTHNINIIISRGRYRSGPHTRGPIFGSPFPDNKKWHYFLINGRVKYAKTSDACSNCVSFFFVSVSPLSSSSHLTYRITYVGIHTYACNVRVTFHARYVFLKFSRAGEVIFAELTRHACHYRDH